MTNARRLALCAALTGAAPPATASAAPPVPGTEKVGVDTAGGKNDESATSSVIDAQGRRVAFGSYSADLVPGDTWDSRHVFVRHLR